MQPAPSEAHQIAQPTDLRSNSPTSLQHGLLSASDQVLDDFASAEVTSEPGLSSDFADDASTASSSTDRGRRLDQRRLSRSQASSQDSSPGSRIDAYERSSATPRKLSEGMIFQIVPSTTGKRSNVSVLDFPNEVLTHILSHLPPETLSSMSLVTRRFHRLVTTPPAWRIAFARYFPGNDVVATSSGKSSQMSIADSPHSERRSFTRLSALASWRSEYILRTRLLRSLGRGRPALQALPKSSNRTASTPAAAVVTYSSNLLYPVSHLHATFGVGLNKKQPLFIHGASEQGAVTTSDPSLAKVGGWGSGDFEAFKHFADSFIGEVEYGLGPGNIVGMPNVMDLSQPYGKLYGEACPGGRLFFTSTMEQRGRFLQTTSSANHASGIPNVVSTGCAVTAVWIAKSEAVLKATSGIFGCLAGFSNGVLAAYALGVNPVHDRRFSHGEPTARWAFCPGVPIIAIIVDEKVNARRVDGARIWATVLNALGEVFYVTDIPSRPEYKGKLTASDIDRLAWQTGRTVAWHLVEHTRRTAKPDPFNTATVDGSYSPSVSSDAHGLSTEQVVAETREVEQFLSYKPKHFRDLCDGWDMRRRLVVDFAGNDHHRGGESILVISCGHDERTPAALRRYTRRKTKSEADSSLDPYPPISAPVRRISIFGGTQALETLSSSPRSTPRSRTSSHDSLLDAAYMVDWQVSNFTFGPLRNVQITAIATDDSDFATLAVNEDPLLGMSGGSNTSSPLASPLGQTFSPSSPAEMPGRRARFIAVGTSTGLVILWNMRSGASPAVDIINSVAPFRCIYTRSPQISSLALTALYVVHGGNDGLVQAWDPLASSIEPIRTLNSRFSDRARRRIAQAEASHHGVGNNYYAAGSIVLDSDPTILRGMVSLGTHLRYWSYSASAADAYKTRKRGQLRRRLDRGANMAASEQRFHHTGRSVIKDYIQHEKQELENEKVSKRRELERLTGRFGTNLLGDDASEEEILAYATMLSEEAFAQDTEKFSGKESGFAAASKAAPFPETVGVTEPLDADMEEAIRLSLLDSEYATESPQTTDFDIPIRFTRGSKRGTPLRQQTDGANVHHSSSNEDDDLAFALRLSLAEQESRGLASTDFPTLSSPSSAEFGTARGKGKGRSKS